MLSKLLLFSVVACTVVLPVLAASDPRPKRGLKRAIAWIVAFNVFYLFALRFIYPRL